MQSTLNDQSEAYTGERTLDAEYREKNPKDYTDHTTRDNLTELVLDSECVTEDNNLSKPLRVMIFISILILRWKIRRLTNLINNNK